MKSKRSLIFCIFLFLSGLTLFSQTMNEMVVLKQAEFRSDQLINASRKDAMGRVCAGLLVYTDLTGLHFDSNNGVVDMTHQPGSYMVFVSEGERVLYIYKDGFRPLEIILSEYGLYGLKSGQVYQLDITAKEKDDAKVLPVVFNVTPADATIKVGSLQFVSGKAQSLPIGENEVVIEKEGYRTIKEKISVDDKNIQFNFTLQQIEPVLVKLRSEPEGATIYINNSERGTTNRDLWLFPGIYEVKLMKSQYQSIDEVIEIEENSENNFSWRLIENFGSIEFTIKPINADLFINKEKRDFSNPVRLAPGSYIIEVKSNRHHDLKETIMINLGDNIEKFYELQPKFGNLYLNTIPSNAQVEIITNGETIDNFIGSNRINDILIGEYVLRVTAEGYKSKEYEIFINENEFLNLNIELIEGIDDTETKATSKSLIVPDSMVLVKGDMFHFNDDHQIRMGDFLIGKYEVTQEEWLEIMEYNNSKVKQEKLPVDNVNWYEAIVFCNKKSIRDSLEPVYRIGNRASTDPAWWGQIPINFDEKWNNVFVNWDANGYRIPTEAEWEYAAKGGHKSMFFKFSGSNDVSEVAWHRGNSSKESNIVGSKKPNELGVYDMSGNLYEWCWGWYGSLKKSLANNLKGSSKGKYRVIRGGCWFSSSGYCKVTKREEKEPWIRDNYTGFRYVRTIK